MKIDFKDKLNFFKKIDNLETIEEKSFWVIAPLVALVGLAGLTTAGFYPSALPTIISAILCLVIPVVLMIVVSRRKNYHSAYPLLCIFIGAFSVPLTFVFSGGFLSGMPLFCVVSTSISALCYSKNWRTVALVSCLFGNMVAFYYVYTYGTPFPLGDETTIFNDIIFAYLFTAVGLFYALSLIINEIRKYKVSQDVLQEYFDIEVRKEILKKAVNGDLRLAGGNKKGVILFADISNFTTITEKMPSELIQDFLNEFFLIADKKIHETGGIIDKYIGDCIMAYWFEQDDSNCVLNAVEAVLNLKKEIIHNSEMIYKKYGVELNFSAGISYGDVIFGDIGSQTRHDYTIIGDAVNVASRIQDHAVGGELLISDSAAVKVKDLVEMESADTNIYFKGKNTSINLYRIIGLIKDNKQKNPIVINDNYGYTLHICGCRGSFPVSGVRFSEYGGETSCYVLKKDDYALVVDCGTGLKNATDILADCKKIDFLLTHVHYDHILGLLMSQPPESAQIRVFGYFDKFDEKSNIVFHFMEHPYWPVKIKRFKNTSVKLNSSIKINDDIKAKFFRADHPDESCVIQLKVKDKKLCFFSDCEDPNKLDDKIAKDADLLFYDGMYDDSEIEEHKGWGHGTWQAGIRYGQKLNIKKLIITHHNPEVGDHTLHLREDEARATYDNVSFAKTGDNILI